MSSPILLDLLTDPLKKKKHRTIPKKIHYFWRMNQKPTSHLYKTQIQILFQGSGAKTYWCLVGECPNPELLTIIPFPSLHLAPGKGDHLENPETLHHLAKVRRLIHGFWMLHLQRWPWWPKFRKTQLECNKDMRFFYNHQKNACNIL